MSKPPDKGWRGPPPWKKRDGGGGRRDEARRDDVRRDDTRRDDEHVRLFGTHAVAAALANPRRPVKRLCLTENAERRLAAEVAARHTEVERMSPRDLDRLLGPDTVHQGAMLETEALPEPELADLAERASEAGPILVLDQITDPHNVGAILRSAAAFGAAGLVMTRRHSPPLDGVLAKSASGALEAVPVALVQNLARAIAELKESGVVLIGLAGEAEAALEAQALRGPLAIILGAEGKGLRQGTREASSLVCRITTGGALASLNVSNAAAVALHVALMQRRADPGSK